MSFPAASSVCPGHQPPYSITQFIFLISEQQEQADLCEVFFTGYSILPHENETCVFAASFPPSFEFMEM